MLSVLSIFFISPFRLSYKNAIPALQRKPHKWTASYLLILPSILFKKSFLSALEISLSKFNFSIVIL